MPGYYSDEFSYDDKPIPPIRRTGRRKRTPFQNNTLKIGELSEKTDVPIVTLRFYEEHRLIKPRKSPDKKTTHRRYLPSVIAEVEFIKLGRRAGFALPEIRSMLKLFRGFKPPAKILMNAVYRTLDRTREQIRSFEEVERIMLLRMRDPQGDIETLMSGDDEIWRLRGLKSKPD
jgi:DNA-binding transcriptional MerR regulator